MSVFHLGDRMTFGHRQRTVGIAATRHGETYGITTIDLGTAVGLFSRDEDIAARELLTAFKIAGDLPRPRHRDYSVASLSELDLLLGVTVRRFAPSHGIVFGEVSALRGRAIVGVAGQRLAVSQLVEVTFDPTDRDGRKAPPLDGAESGALITTWNGRVIGLLIAGIGRVAFVAPLHEFLAAENLVHGEIVADAGLGAGAPPEDEEEWKKIRRGVAESRAGIDSLGAELGREFSLGLPELGEDAA